MLNEYVLSVTQLNEYVSTLIRNDLLLGSVSLRGEISGFKRHSSGHLYFSMKDEASVVRCVMFRQNAMGLPFQPKDGMQVVARGYASLYTRDGQFQFYAKSIEQEGEGELYRRFLMLKTRLEAQGLFDPAHKKPLPRLPRCVGIVTSPTGAALQDIVNVARRRYPMMNLLLAPVLVQGPGAAEEIARGIRALEADGRADVIIAGRGGGSMEELWAFNEEIVARAVYECGVPIVSAVGHETDFSIADFAADMRAPTPSAAAELCVPEYEAMSDELERLRDELYAGCNRSLERRMNALEAIAKSGALAGPGHALLAQAQRLDMAKTALMRGAERLFGSAQSKLDVNRAALEGFSPHKTLQRGFALVRSARGYQAGAAGLDEGEAIELIMRDGTARATVSAVCLEGEEYGEKSGNL